jgi:hypothetical protein
MLPFRAANKLSASEFRVRQNDRPDWVRGTTRLPQAGEEIYCAAGAGTVTALHGKTGDGSRLVQIGLEADAKHPFYAAASNVLLPPADMAVGEDAHRALVEPYPWLGGSGGEARLG